MGAGVWFWLIYVIFGVMGLLGMGPWFGNRWGPYGPLGGWVILFLLVGLLGLPVFGNPVK